MEKLSTIQKRENLNEVYASEKGVGGAAHKYIIKRRSYDAVCGNEKCVFNLCPHKDKESCSGFLPKTDAEVLCEINFQEGARKDPNALHGVTNEDLLEIVRDRLIGFQSGEFATRENACALTHIEEALMWMNKRVEDRIERNVLGTYNK